MHSRITAAIAALLLSVTVALFVHASAPIGRPAASSSQAGGLDHSDLPFALRDVRSPANIRRGHQVGYVTASAPDKRISIHWIAREGINSPPDFSLEWDMDRALLGDSKEQSGLQAIPLRFFPTAVCAVGSDALLVAGMSSNGDTIIEEYELVWPSTMPIPLGHANPYPHVTVEIANPSIGRAQRHYEASLPGRHLVRAMCAVRPTHAQFGTCLVMFDDSLDVCILSLQDSSLTVLASPADTAAAFGIVPSLTGDDLLTIKSSNHASHGYIYEGIRGFGRVPGPTSGPTPLDVIFADADRDGVIDSVLEISRDEHAQAEWTDWSNYIDPHLD